jgi:hypothetical protein
MAADLDAIYNGVPAINSCLVALRLPMFAAKWPGIALIGNGPKLHYRCVEMISFRHKHSLVILSDGPGSA